MAGLQFSLDMFVEQKFDTIKFFRVQWEPEAFAQKACDVQHPLGLQFALPAELAAAIRLATEDGLHVVARKRAEFFKKWSQRAEELVDAEKNSAVRWILALTCNQRLKGKGLVLFKEMLEYYEYPERACCPLSLHQQFLQRKRYSLNQLCAGPNCCWMRRDLEIRPSMMKFGNRRCWR